MASNAATCCSPSDITNGENQTDELLVDKKPDDVTVVTSSIKGDADSTITKEEEDYESTERRRSVTFQLGETPESKPAADDGDECGRMSNIESSHDDGIVSGEIPQSILVDKPIEERKPIKKKKEAAGLHLDFNLLIRSTCDTEEAPSASGIRSMNSSSSAFMMNQAPSWNNLPSQSNHHHLTDTTTSTPTTSSSDNFLRVGSGRSFGSNREENNEEYATQQYGENDYKSHRSDVVHMPHPMTTRLSSTDMKTIKTAVLNNKKQQDASTTTTTNKKKSRRHRRNSGSSSKETKEQKKQRKKKEMIKKRNLQGIETTIPEENEESDNEIDDECFIDNHQDEKEVGNITGSNNITSAGAGGYNNATFNIESDDPVTSYTTTPSEKTKLEIEEEERSKKKKHHHKHHHHHHRHHRHHDKLKQRRISGYMKKELDEQNHYNQLSDDDVELAGAQQDDIKSHRYEDRVGMRNHLLHRPVHKRKKRQEIKEEFDRNPHEIYVELDELKDNEWNETARWLKFEEDVEESQMWGKPHAASLSFHSLHDLRRSLQYGTVILDLKARTLEEIARCAVEEMSKQYNIDELQRNIIFDLIMRKHRNYTTTSSVPTSPTSPTFIGKRHLPARSSLISKISQPILSRASRAAHHVSTPSSGNEGYITTPFDDSNNEPTTIKFHQYGKPSQINMENLKLMKKIPPNCESAGIFVAGNMEELHEPCITLIRLSEGILIDDMVSLPIPIRFIFMLFGPQQQDFNYHEIGRSMSTLLSDQEFRVMAYRAECKDEILGAINEFLDDSVVLAPYALENIDMLKHLIDLQKDLAKRNKKRPQSVLPSGDEMSMKDEKQSIGSCHNNNDDNDGFDPLKRTGRYFGGFYNDIKRRYTKYWSDIKDGFNLQCIAAFIFIYFAALSPAITFGGLLGEKTNNLMGASEMLLGCSISGVLYGLFAGQPMLIIGSTGPLLVFEEAVYEFCKSSGVEFLAFRVWIGFWISCIAVSLVMFEGSFIIRYITKFTEEIFSTLISFIFIFETFNKLAKTFQEHPLQEYYPNITNDDVMMTSSNVTTSDGNMTSLNNSDVIVSSQADIYGQPNTALLTTLLMLGTFFIATFLRMFKDSKFFGSNVRRTIGDFGVPISIFIMVSVDYLIKDTYTQKLNVPQGISPTSPDQRGWFINPINPLLPWYMCLLAIIPAALVFILIFMESQIAEMIISKKERNLQKGTGFHLDIFIIGLLNSITSILGMPWVCAATLRSITHANSLTIMDNRRAPGESPKISGVHEQRVTTICVNAMLGVSILMQPLLKEIPLAVLFGIFLYMGVMSLNGVDLVERIYMLFMPAKNYPDFSFVRMVQPWRIHVFTIIQMIFLAILWAVKSTIIKISFPFVLVLTVPFRYFVLNKFFTKRELQALD